MWISFTCIGLSIMWFSRIYFGFGSRANDADAETVSVELRHSVLQGLFLTELYLIVVH